MNSLILPAAARRGLAVVLTAMALATMAACTSDGADPETTTTTTADTVLETTVTTIVVGDEGQLVFGDGVIPETVPEGFPFPDEANVGATMIDRVNGVTEVVIVFPANIEDVVDYYETNLEVLGFTVDSSEGTGVRWVIALSEDDVTGEIRLEVPRTGLTQGLIRIETPTDS